MGVNIDVHSCDNATVSVYPADKEDHSNFAVFRIHAGENVAVFYFTSSEAMLDFADLLKQRIEEKIKEFEAAAKKPE